MDPAMQTVAVILAGVCVVIGGVLVFRLHAFLGITLAALLVALLTPSAAVERFYVGEVAHPVAAADGAVQVDTTGTNLLPGALVAVLAQDPESGNFTLRGNGRLNEIPAGEDPKRFELSVPDGVTTGDAASAKLFVADPTELRQARSSARRTIGSRVTAGFGSTCASIGILIAMAAIIGKCLLESGAADRIVRSALRVVGIEGAPVAFLFSGFLLAVPVFFDTVFYLMIPLGKATRIRTGKNYLFYVLSIIAGATMAHSMVPPTPGPLVVVEAFGINMGLMIIAGSIVGLFSAGSGFLFAYIANRFYDLPLRDSEDFSLEELRKTTEVDESQLPPLWLSLIPILLPVVLIAGEAILSEADLLSGRNARIAATLGDKTIALTLGAAVALATLIRQSGKSLKDLAGGIQGALASGGTIILITAAGGAFGAVLRETGVSTLIRDLPQSSPMTLCLTAWAISAAIRASQGSATVAMITCAGIFSGLAHDPSLPFHPIYLALAIGAGSKPLSWMNDSGFWVMTRMSGMTEKEGLMFVTVITTIMGIVGLIVTLIGLSLWPTL